MSEIDLSSIQPLAEAAGQQHLAYEAALEAAAQAEADLLEAAIARVRPGLRAICSRPKCGETSTGLATDRQRESVERAPWRGVLIAGDGGPVRDAPRDNQGEYQGCGVYLREDGCLVQVEYSGSWSRWQGSGDEWHASERAITAIEFARSYEVEGAISALVAALQAQIEGAKGRRTAAAAERAGKMRALASLIGGGK